MIKCDKTTTDQYKCKANHFFCAELHIKTLVVVIRNYINNDAICLAEHLLVLQ